MLLYATLGDKWAFGSRITYSFAPEGTNVGGSPNALPSRMSALGISEADWKNAFRTAAASWAVSANINLVETSDDGSPIGTSGNQQNDSRFGDIRIAAIDLGAGAVGLSFLPPDSNGGTQAGDILLNTSLSWSISGNYNIQTVAMHEFGHALGLDHSSLTYAEMYPYYNGVKMSLSADDTAGIKAVWGDRAGDSYEFPTNNDIYTRPTDVTGLLDSSAQVRLTASITSTADIDFYKITVPAGPPRTMTVTMQSSNLSSLSPRVLVTSMSLQSLGTQTAPNTFGSTVTVVVPNAVGGTSYLIRAMPANAGVTGAGAYGLIVNLGTSPSTPIAPPNTTVLEQPDQGGGSSSLSSDDAGRMVTPRGRLAAWRASAESRDEQAEDAPIRLGSLTGYGHLLTVGSTVSHRPTRGPVAATAPATPQAGLALAPVPDTPVIRAKPAGGRHDARSAGRVDSVLQSLYG